MVHSNRSECKKKRKGSSGEREAEEEIDDEQGRRTEREIRLMNLKQGEGIGEDKILSEA